MRGIDVYIMFDHIMLQNELFYRKEGKSLIKEVDNYKVILVLDFLQRYTIRMDTIGFSLEKMIKNYGYSVSTKKGESVPQFKNILKFLQEKKMLEFININEDKEFTIDKVQSNAYIECKMNIGYDKGFIQLKNEEIETIACYDKTKIDNLQLLVLYCYLKCRIYKHKKDDDVVKNGGRAETCYVSFELIESDIGLSKSSCMKYINILVELNLIRYVNPGLWYYSSSKETKRESPNVYCLYDGDELYCRENLKQGIKQYKNSDENKGKTWTGNREYRNNNRQLNGEKGAILKKIKKGTATDKDEIRLKEINDLIAGAINEEVRLTELFKEINEQVGEVLLSEYYDGYKQDLSDKYYVLENSLGLFDDEEGELKTDYTYYKWIMSNYKEDNHSYYVNCIKKKIKEANQNDDPIVEEVEVKPVEPIEIIKPFGGFYNNLNKKSRKQEESNPFENYEKNSELIDIEKLMDEEIAKNLPSLEPEYEKYQDTWEGLFG